MWEQIKIRIIKYLFSYLYADFNYPFQTSDEKLMRMTEAGQEEYMEAAKLILDNPVFIQEVQELRRHYYKLLALDGSIDRIKGALFLGALMTIDGLETRLKTLVRSKGEIPDLEDED